MLHEGSGRTAFSRGPVSPSNPRTSESWCRPTSPTLFPWHWAREPVLGIIKKPHRSHSTSAPQMVPDPEKGRMVMGSPPKPRLTVSSERSCGSGRISPLLSPTPRRGAEQGGAAVSAQVLRDPSARPRCAGSPTGGGSVPPCAWEGKLGGRALQRNKAAPPQLTPFPEPFGFLLYLPTQPGLPEPQRKGW